MTVGNPQRGVLVLGKSQIVLDKTVAALRDAGYAGYATNDFFGDITRRFDATKIDLALFGTLVPVGRRAEIREEIGAINPGALFVDGLAGIPGLIVSQVQGAFAADHRDPAHAPGYTPAGRLIRLTLVSPADVTVTAWWRTPSVAPDLKSDSLTLLDAPLAPGDHTIPVPGDTVPRQQAWASVRIGQAVYAFAITT